MSEIEIRPRVLVVGDEHLRGAMSLLLPLRGYEVIADTDGAELPLTLKRLAAESIRFSAAIVGGNIPPFYSEQGRIDVVEAIRGAEGFDGVIVGSSADDIPGTDVTEFTTRRLINSLAEKVHPDIDQMAA